MNPPSSFSVSNGWTISVQVRPGIGKPVTGMIGSWVLTIKGTGERSGDYNRFNIKKSRGGYLINHSGASDITVREYHLGEEFIFYLDVGGTGSLLL
ncbi:unnamed protein product [Arabis nemorensis]|uniref:Uncharacterized protein n=1 Tax=Arabis nemorensis TaxID=586526 RepID=A0A565CA56_9BRAS|nr:unnamed protein product [Arabis nemorensis]